MIEGIIIGIGSTLGATILIGAGIILARLWRCPKRCDRLEAVIPPLLRAVQALLVVAKAGKANGEVDESIEELRQLTTDGVVSRKACA